MIPNHEMQKKKNLRMTMNMYQFSDDTFTLNVVQIVKSDSSATILRSLCCVVSKVAPSCHETFIRNRRFSLHESYAFMEQMSTVSLYKSLKIIYKFWIEVGAQGNSGQG